jgi:two-component system chemotaxis response regulator CheB
MDAKYSVIVVDDSKFMRSFLKDMIEKIGEFQVVATAKDAFEARDLIKKFEPDLVTIDVNMPKMDGVSFLRNLMRLHPMPAIVVSTDVSKSKEVFDDGAIGFVAKPAKEESNEDFFARLSDTLLRYTYLLERYTLKKPKPKREEKKEVSIQKRNHPDTVLASKPATSSTFRLIALGSSTGGIETLMQIFKGIGSIKTPIVIAQHIPYGFSNSFAQRLDSVAAIAVKQVEDGEVLEPYTAYLAPGDKHLIIEKEGMKLVANVSGAQKVSMHRPSVDILFRSVNNSVGSKALGIILTGMGDDGIIGLKEMFDNGCHTVAQDKQSCVVYGMPKRAVETGAAKEVKNIASIIQTIKNYS